MIKLEKTDVFGWETAIRGMRNPMNSWDKSDSGLGCLSQNIWGKVEHRTILCKDCAATYESHCICNGKKQFVIGENDLKLMKNLSKAGNDHAKYLRMINVTVDITAPLYWWKEFDTYKVGTVANSCSTMHKITSKPIELSDFSIDDFNIEDDYNEIALEDMFINVVADCESLRQKYLETKDKRYWKGLIQLLPNSYNQKRTVQLNYQVLKNMYFSRRNHKLDEWHTLCEWCEELPYFKEICIEIKNGENK